MIRRLSLICLGILALFPVAPRFCVAQEKPGVEMLFELPPEDDLTIDKKTVVDKCSQVIRRGASAGNEAQVNALRQRYIAYLFLRDPQKAKADLDELVSLQPKNIEDRGARVAILLRLKMWDDAKKEAQAMARLAPDHPKTLFSLGYVAARDNDFETAIPLLDKAITLDPKYVEAYCVRGTVCKYLDPSLCLRDLNKALELRPYMPERLLEQIHFARAVALGLLGRPREALSSLLVACKINGSSFEINRELALVYGDLGKLNLAAHYAEKCVAIDPDQAAGHALCAICYSRIDRLVDAKGHALTASRLGAEDESIRCLIAEAQSAVGEYATALRFYDKALAENPGHFLAKVRKASLLATCPDAKFRDTSQAIALARKAFDQKDARNVQKCVAAMVVAEAYAESGNYAEAADWGRRCLEFGGPDFGKREEWQGKVSMFEKKRVP